MSGPVKGQCCQEQGRDLSVVDRWWRSGKDYSLRRSNIEQYSTGRTTPEKSPVEEVNVEQSLGVVWASQPVSVSEEEQTFGNLCLSL